MNNHINTVFICGAGTMGRGIAIASAAAGFLTYLYDQNDDYLQQSLPFIGAFFQKSVEKGKITDKQRQEYLQNILTVDSLDNIVNSDIVIEAIIENQEIKEALFVSIENNGLKDNAILATNTSSLSIGLLSSSRKYPGTFVGLHFFNPASIMKLVEVVRGIRTTDETVNMAVQFAAELGKTPVVAKDVPGFIVNRVARNYYNESLRLVTEQAAEIKQIDNLLKGVGFKMGPFELMDLIGNDVNLEVTKSVYAQYFHEPRFAPSPLQQEYVHAGLYGKKTGNGFYQHDKTR